METTLHQQLKRRYAQDASSTEVAFGRYRIDAIRDNELIEIQCGSLSAISRKCKDLLQRHSLRVVKPVIIRTRIAKSKKPDGPVTSRRFSPSRGSLLDVFEELIYFTRIFPHDNLTIEVPMLTVEQWRTPARKRKRRWQKNYRVKDVRLESVENSFELREPSDLLDLVKLPKNTQSFTTADLAKTIDRPRWVAQQIAYVLRKTGAIEPTDRDRRGIIYEPKSTQPYPASMASMAR